METVKGGGHRMAGPAHIAWLVTEHRKPESAHPAWLVPFLSRLQCSGHLTKQLSLPFQGGQAWAPIRWLAPPDYTLVITWDPNSSTQPLGSYLTSHPFQTPVRKSPPGNL